MAPFIAAALRQPADQTEHSTSPDFISFPVSEETESIVEESPEASVAGIDYPPESEASVLHARGRRSERSRVGAATAAAVVGIELVRTFLIGSWGTSFGRRKLRARPLRQVSNKLRPDLAFSLKLRRDKPLRSKKNRARPQLRLLLRQWKEAGSI